MLVALLQSATEGPISEALREFPFSLSPQNGVEGVNLRYATRFMLYLEENGHLDYFEGSKFLRTFTYWQRKYFADFLHHTVIPKYKAYTGEWPYVIEIEFSKDFLQNQIFFSSGFEISLESQLPSSVAGVRVVYRYTEQPELHQSCYVAEFRATNQPDYSLDYSFGTLGCLIGFTGAGNALGLTCAHVAGSLNRPGICFGRLTLGFNLSKATSWLGRLPSRFVPKSLQPMGLSVRGLDDADDLPKTRIGSPLDVKSKGLDIALIEVYTNRALQTFEMEPAIDFMQDEYCQFYGARSGLRRARVSSISIFHTYTIKLSQANSRKVCVSGCVQISSRSATNTLLSQPGDSGALVLLNEIDDGERLHPMAAGILLGGDGITAGIVRADQILGRMATPVSSLYGIAS